MLWGKEGIMGRGKNECWIGTTPVTMNDQVVKEKEEKRKGRRSGGAWKVKSGQKTATNESSGIRVERRDGPREIERANATQRSATQR